MQNRYLTLEELEEAVNKTDLYMDVDDGNIDSSDSENDNDTQRTFVNLQNVLIGEFLDLEMEENAQESNEEVTRGVPVGNQSMT